MRLTLNLTTRLTAGFAVEVLDNQGKQESKIMETVATLKALNKAEADLWRADVKLDESEDCPFSAEYLIKLEAKDDAYDAFLTAYSAHYGEEYLSK